MKIEPRTAESYAQEALDKRGYLVVRVWMPRVIGEQILIQTQPNLYLGCDASDGIAVVTQETDMEDFIEQCLMFGIPLGDGSAPYYYRAVAE